MIAQVQKGPGTQNVFLVSKPLGGSLKPSFLRFSLQHVVKNSAPSILENFNPIYSLRVLLGPDDIKYQHLKVALNNPISLKLSPGNNILNNTALFTFPRRYEHRACARSRLAKQINVHPAHFALTQLTAQVH